MSVLSRAGHMRSSDEGPSIAFMGRSGFGAGYLTLKPDRRLPIR